MLKKEEKEIRTKSMEFQVKVLGRSRAEARQSVNIRIDAEKEVEKEFKNFDKSLRVVVFPDGQKARISLKKAK